MTPYTYDLRGHEGRVTKYVPAGASASDADAERVRREKMASARAVASDAGLRVEDEAARETVKDSAARYIRNVESRRATEATMQARLVLDEFMATCRRVYLDEITREDILRFHKALRRRHCAPRTVANKYSRLKSFLLFCKVDPAVVPPEPRYDVELPTVYTREQVGAAVCNADDRLRVVIGLALKCGLREKEIVHLEWRDIDWDEGVLRVRSKAAYGFRVKDSGGEGYPYPR